MISFYKQCLRRRQLGPKQDRHRPQRGALRMESLEDRTVLSGSGINVDTLSDVVDPNDGMTSLREAIAVAAENVGDDVIRLPSGTYALSDQLEINDPSGKVTIRSRGRAMIDAQGGSRVINVVDSDVELKRLHLTGGSAMFGGGINAERSVVVLKHTLVSDNAAQVAAGGIRVSDGSHVSLHRSKVTGNTASFGGGGIGGSGGVHIGLHQSVVKHNTALVTGGGLALGENDPTSPLSNSLDIRRSVVAHNSASVGGGISIGLGDNTLEVRRSSVYANTATGAPIPIPEMAFLEGNGGGIAILPSAQNTAMISRSIVRQNSSSNDGGGIWNAGNMVVDNSLIHRNSAGGNGGGIVNFATGSLSIEDWTVVVGNRAGGEGGGVYNSAGGTLSIDRVFSIFGNRPDNVFDANL